MSERLDVVAVSDHVRDTYLRYLRTLLPLRDARIERAVHAAMGSHSELVKGPLLEATPPYAQGPSLGQLIDDGVLHERLRRLGHESGIPLDRPLYEHQDRAIRRAVAGRNLVVATGTGSGKTEGFLLPILSRLMSEAAEGTLDQPGVRAMLLYPMNALANDQLKRLRDLLAAMPEVTFGRYTGETKHSPQDADEHFRHRHPGRNRLPNELLSRDEMQGTPPHLLLTNYAMLEYLLLRPKDHALFDADTGGHWRFVVLDEAHVYDGAGGIEVAMLLRRLRDRVSRGRALQFILTSATVGGTHAGPDVASFASTLTGSDFEYVDNDPAHQDVVWATRRELEHVDPWGELPEDAYRAVLEAEDRSATLAAYPGVPQGPDHHVLGAERRVRRAQELLGSGPRPLADVAAQLFPDAYDAIEQTGELIALGASVRDHEGASLIPARYHLWVRATEGAFTCLSEDGPHAFLTRHEVCPTCTAPVFEVGSCKRCSATYLMGTRQRVGDREVLAPPKEIGKPLTWFVLQETGEQQDGSPPGRVDEDDATLEDIALDDIPGHTRESLCIRCGAIQPADTRNCVCGGPVRPVVAVGEPKAVLRSCGLCGGRSNAGQVRRLTSGTDAAVAVLSTAVYTSLPPDTDPKLADKPGAGRKMLLFADSRQDAAYFAPYLEDSYQQLVRRRIVLSALEQVSQLDPEPRLGDVAYRAVSVADQFGLFDWRAGLAEKQAATNTWVQAETLSFAASNSLEGLGLVTFGFRRPPGLEMPTPLTDLGMTDDDAWAFVGELLRSLRAQGVVSYPDGVQPKAPEFEPRTGPIFARLEGPEPKKKVLSWLPGRGANTRTDYVRRVATRLGNPVDVTEMLRGLWRWLTDGPAGALLRTTSDPQLGVLRQLDHALITMRGISEDARAYRCRRCLRFAPRSVAGVCLTMGCEGELRPWAPPVLETDDDHYRTLARQLHAIPLSASEHTAQFTPTEAARIQEGFLNGELNVLSCSTTFELGVDVGELQTVVLRNVPPTTSNYVQRAGRAGRRTDAAALVVTYAQQRSHDLTHFGEPEKMIAGHVRPPRVSVENERIARRHAQAIALAAYFRDAFEQRRVDYRTVADLFGDDHEDARLIDWLESAPEDVSAAIGRALPEALHPAIGLTDGAWTKLFVEHLQRLGEEQRFEVGTYRELEEGASAEGKHGLAGVYQRVINTLERRYLLAQLSSKNILPKYGFPVDTVELRTRHVGTSEGMRLELDRDLTLAISDYAPGAETVAGGYVWRSAGVYRLPDRDFPERHYAACGCGFYEEKVEQFTLDFCPACGRGGRLAPTVRRYIVPEFGFLTSRTPPKRPTSRPERVYTGQVHLVAGSASAERLSVPLSDGRTIDCRYLERGQLAVINNGPLNMGYRICVWCGAGEPARAGQRTQTRHESPLTGKECGGMWNWVDLGHRFETDVLELHFPALGVPPASSVWRGVLYALVEAASDVLEIARDDLDGTLHYGGGIAPTLVLYDNVPAGAGHVKRIKEVLPEVLQAALQRVEDCECGVETSCYRCLRGFRNQRFHDELRRGAVAQLLGGLLAPETRVAASVSREHYEPVSVTDLTAFDGRDVLIAVDGAELVGTLWVEADADVVTTVQLTSDAGEALMLDPDAVTVRAVRRI